MSITPTDGLEKPRLTIVHLKLWQIWKPLVFHLLFLHGSLPPPICPHFSLYYYSGETLDLVRGEWLSWRYCYSLLREIRFWSWQRVGMTAGPRPPGDQFLCSLFPRNPHLLVIFPSRSNVDFFFFSVANHWVASDISFSVFQLDTVSHSSMLLHHSSFSRCLVQWLSSNQSGPLAGSLHRNRGHTFVTCSHQGSRHSQGIWQAAGSHEMSAPTFRDMQHKSLLWY